MARSLRVAAVGDLHCTKTSEGAFQPLFAKMAESADVLVLCGDLTDYGTPDEARILAKEWGEGLVTLDWSRLARRFGQHWRVLPSHLILFGCIYPTSAGRCWP